MEGENFLHKDNKLIAIVVYCLTFDIQNCMFASLTKYSV